MHQKFFCQKRHSVVLHCEKISIEISQLGMKITVKFNSETDYTEVRLDRFYCIFLVKNRKLLNSTNQIIIYDSIQLVYHNRLNEYIIMFMLQGSSDGEESIENKLPFNRQADFTSHGCPCGWLIQCFPCDLKTILSLYTQYKYITVVTFQPFCKLTNNKMYT